MNLTDNNLKLGLDLDLDIEAQNETTAHDRVKGYQLKVANRFEYIIFEKVYINPFILFITFACSYIFGFSLIILTIYKYINLNGLS